MEAVDAHARQIAIDKWVMEELGVPIFRFYVEFTDDSITGHQVCYFPRHPMIGKRGEST